MENVHKQRELELFVEREVICGQTFLIDQLLRDDFLSWDDVENLEYTEQELLDQGYTATEIENGEAQVDKAIYEWWLVSSWLIAKLRDRGEAILVNEYGAWWGRSCTGQAIALDGVIEDIYNELIAS
jgi:hypothetical protein